MDPMECISLSPTCNADLEGPLCKRPLSLEQAASIFILVKTPCVFARARLIQIQSPLQVHLPPKLELGEHFAWGSQHTEAFKTTCTPQAPQKVLLTCLEPYIILLHIYIYVYTHIFLYVCIYIYIYISLHIMYICMYMAALKNIGLVTGPGGLFATRLATESAGLATNPPCDKPTEDHSTLHRGPRQGFVTEGP